MFYFVTILFLVFLGAFVFQNKTLPGSRHQLIKPKEAKPKPKNNYSEEEILEKADRENEFADIIEDRPVAKRPQATNTVKQSAQTTSKPVAKSTKQLNSDAIFINKTPLPSDNSTMLREQSALMSREAADLKHVNLPEAIDLLKSSIRMSPVKNYEDYFKLAHYLHLNGQPLESYEIYNNLLEGLDFNDIVLYNAAISNITEKICTRKYKDNEYKDYLYYYSFWLYNHTVSLACRGYIDELNDILKRKDKLHYLAPTKVDGAFKYLEKEKEKDIFSYYISMYLAKMRQPLLIAVRKAYNANVQIRRNGSSSLPSATNQLLLKDSEFIANFKLLNDTRFLLFYKEKLSPILNNGEVRRKKIS